MHEFLFHFSFPTKKEKANNRFNLFLNGKLMLALNHIIYLFLKEDAKLKHLSIYSEGRLLPESGHNWYILIDCYLKVVVIGILVEDTMSYFFGSYLWV